MYPLLSLEEGFDPYALVSQGIFSKILPASKTGTMEKIEALMLSWIRSISQDHMNAQNNPVEIPLLKESCRSLIQQDKVGILQDGLKKHGLINRNLQERIEWLTQEILSCLSIPQVRMSVIPSLHGFYPLQGAIAQSQTSQRARSLTQEVKLGQLLRTTKANTPEAKEKIFEIFNSITLLDEKIELLNKLPPTELYVVIEILYPHLTSNELIEFLCKIEIEQFLELLYLTSHALISEVRQKIFSGSEEKLEEFKIRSQNALLELSRQCNRHLKAELGNLADFFRSTPLHKTDLYKFEEITKLSNRFLHQQDIAIKLERLMRFFEWDIFLINTCKDLSQSYTRSSMRLLRSHYNLPDSLYKILNDKAFGKYKDLEDASEMMFEAWNFTEREELVRVGILKRVTDEKDWLVAKENLKSFGLNTVADLRAKGIFNKALLADYIAKQTQPQNLAALAAAGGDV